ncbi:MAG: RNA polymerase-binding protein DksA [Alphaproteobacteria bacterium]|nr:RNA polymerase-binding protein DksA [Alphaproteobacteria bacterium]
MKDELPQNEPRYIPSPDEPYMNERQRKYFHDMLVAWRDELSKDIQETAKHLREGEEAGQDEVDHAEYERDIGIEIRTRERELKLVTKIDQALRRIKENRYGYCVETKEPIGIPRLLVRPIANMTKAAQERHEAEERKHKDGKRFL